MTHQASADRFSLFSYMLRVIELMFCFPDGHPDGNRAKIMITNSAVAWWVKNINCNLCYVASFTVFNYKLDVTHNTEIIICIYICSFAF